jgi:DNA-binding NtrC family response regulator
MLIVFVDTDADMQQRLAESLSPKHQIVAFAELYEAYKWIKHNDIPDVIVTEMDVESSMGLQSLRFLQSKAKLKQTHLLGFTHQPGNYADLVKSEGAAGLFAKNSLVEELSSYINVAANNDSVKGKTLQDVETARGLKKATTRKKQTF